jgi:hypothetical protein
LTINALWSGEPFWRHGACCRRWGRVASGVSIVANLADGNFGGASVPSACRRPCCWSSCGQRGYQCVCPNRMFGTWCWTTQSRPV